MRNDFLTGRVSTIFIPTLYTIVFLISMPHNAIAMVTFVCRIRTMKPAVIYMLNLAAADLLFSMLLPFKIVSHYSGNDWGFGEGLCRLVTAGIFCNMYCSILLMTCISVDRLLAVAYPIASLGWRRPSSAALACGIMWVLAVGGTLPLVLSRQTLYNSSLSADHWACGRGARQHPCGLPAVTMPGEHQLLSGPPHLLFWLIPVPEAVDVRAWKLGCHQGKEWPVSILTFIQE
ncbi:hypothetical protein DPEC_G00324830 [Dallia pectoralis]|uniref:Uncharacterized protein n=1 Tax=Dallia pectoralis TaxID=75939 RepID=A0ACC2FBD0_DALPE|nr:hypothetical protein DPEC_G00324830 [Dallia pectoralis]